MPQTGWLIKNRNVFITVLEARKPKIKVPAGWVSCEDPFPDSQMGHLLTVSPHGRRVEGVL